MRKILVGLPVTMQQRQTLLSACRTYQIVFKPLTEIGDEDICDAEAIVGNVAPKLLKSASQLRWLQLNSAGTDDYIKPGVLRKDIALTNAAGAYGLAVSEYMVAAVLSMAKRLHQYRDNMTCGSWKDEGPVLSISGSNTLVLGTGDIGSAFAKRMAALGSTVWGIRRNVEENVEPFRKIVTMDALERLLPEMDIVALTLPGAPALNRFFDQSKFMAMKESALLINAGRGTLIDLKALRESLEKREIYAAILDVTDPEPLPADHPLWKCQNLLITPHVAGGYHLPCILENVVRITAENICRLEEGRKLLNLVKI